MPEVPKIDEFAFVLMAGILFIFILTFAWTTPTEGPPVVDETYFEITADQGETRTFDFIIKGQTILSSVNISGSGEVANWITFNRNDFDIDKDGSMTVTATLKIPSNVSTGRHSGRVVVKGKGGRDTFSVYVDISEERSDTSTTPVFLGDFSVSYTRGTDVLDSKEDIRVSGGYISERSIVLTGLITDEKLSITTDASVRLVIDVTNQAGNLIILLDSHEIYNKKVGTGEILIPIEKGLLEKSNMITIRAGSPGWKFWINTVYKIQRAEFNIDYEGAFSQTFNISMTKNEVDNFKRLSLYYRVPSGGYSVPLADMMIKINNQIVYWDSPPLAFFDRSFSEDMFGNSIFLNEGTNTITFMFEEQARYSMSDAMLTIEYYV